MTRTFVLFAITLLLFLLNAQSSYASETNGTISPSQHYAWSNNSGWVNWDAIGSNVAITDSAVTGFLWSANHGWINLSPSNGGVLNDGEGNLSGSAWDSGTGWIDFTGVVIGATGVFSGQTTSNTSFGVMAFDCGNCAVSTDWRPFSIRSPTAPPSSGGGGGGGGGGGSVRRSFIPSLPATGSTASTSLIQSIAQAILRSPDLGVQPVLPLGAVSENVRTLQIFLNTLGFTLAEVGPGSPGRETNIFGPLTKAALAQFQAQNGITPAMGYFGPKTRAFIAALTLPPSVPVQTGQAGASVMATDPIFTRDLERGMSGLDVTVLQQLLIAKNTGPAAEALARSGTSTYFGTFTEAAVIEYQKAHGITPTMGYFGPKTRTIIAGQR